MSPWKDHTMNVKRFYAGLTGLVLAGGFAGGLANSAQASTGPPIHGVVTRLHSIRLDAGFAALPMESSGRSCRMTPAPSP